MDDQASTTVEPPKARRCTARGDIPEPSRHMRVLYFSNEFPNDDLERLLRSLHLLSQDQKHPVLARFFERVTRTVREEARNLTAELKKLVPGFESVIDLAREHELRESRLRGSIDGVLHASLSLATFIAYHEAEDIDIDSAQMVLTGLGLGLLSSSAISLSPTLEDLPIIGTEVVRIAFRLGVHVAAVSQHLEYTNQEGVPDSWAYVVDGTNADDAQKELDTIHARDNTPELAKIFISAISATSIVISGPPSRLRALLRTSAFFRDRKHFSLPVYDGLCHAGHIYTQQDVEEVVQIPELGCRFRTRIPVLSTSTGKPFTATTATELLQQIISEVMTQQIAWDNVIKGVIEHANSHAASEFQVTVFRVSLPVTDLTKGLTSNFPNSSVATEDLISWLVATHNEKRDPRTPLQSKIAIVGMSCRMPGGAADTEKFWELLEKGLDVHRKVPVDRFDIDTHHDPTGKRVNTSHTAYGCFIDEPGLFDAPFFNMSPREAKETDPMQRLALVTAYEALERAGYVANRTPATQLSRIGTWYGQASDDYREVNTAQEVGTYFITGGCRAFGNGRINYFFKFAGPSFNCDTACSSSLATIQAACTALWAGEVDTVVSGGLNVLTNSDAFAGLSNGHFLTKTPNACKTWDSEADGYCRADGIVSIVMKRLEDAEADNDNILGVIRAAATNHSANAISITHPHAGHQADLYRKVLGRAGVDPLDVSYVELHGTGTQAGDGEEMRSITQVFAPIKRGRNARQPLHIGAVKSNVGHSEAAAGATALMKVLLMLSKGTIPRHVGIKGRINPKLPQDLDKRNVRIPYEQTEWRRPSGQKRIAAVNSFSAAGGNTTILIEEPPTRQRTEQDPRPSHIVALSAKSKASLKGNLEKFVTFLNQNPDVSIADLSYTTTARRYHHNYRIVVSTSSGSHLKQQLMLKLEHVETIRPISPTGPPSVAFVFTGQGAAERSMSLDLYHHSPFFRSQIQLLDMLGHRQGFPSIIPAIDGSFAKDHTHSPTVTQLSLVCIEIALAKYWESLGIKPDVVLGHSLGEYAALCVAGVLSASDTIFLAGSRALLLERKCQVGSHRMMAVKAPEAEIEANSNRLPYDVACINGPNETVLAGTVAEMQALAVALQDKGYRCVTLDVDYAIHSAATDAILEEYLELANGALFQPPKLPVISPVLGKVVFDEKSVNAKYLQKATRNTVDFLTAVRKACDMSIIDKDTVWIEIGPHPVCVGFITACLGSPSPLTVPSFRRGENNWTTLARSLGDLHCAGASINWGELHKPFEKNLRLLDLPTYCWNDSKYWIQYNGDWALTKGNTYYDAEKRANQSAVAEPLRTSSIRTSTVQQVVDEHFEGASGKVIIQSDLMQADFLAAAHGHSMNNCGVVTSSIHADIAYTLGGYLHRKLLPKVKRVDMNITGLEVVKGLVAQSNTKVPQLIQVSAITADISSQIASLEWHNVSNDGTVQDRFASAYIVYGDAEEWLASWAPMTHLVQSRIEVLEKMARDGAASRFSNSMAYSLFANNLVDYASKYRGMQMVVLSEFEAFADIRLTKEESGTWTVPPYFIDSVAHLAGFVMNVSDASDTAKTYCVTPGWRTMRFAKPLLPGSYYRSYVKMIPTTEDPTIYLGDVYILQDDVIVGMVGGIQFRRYPRILLNRFFSPPDATGSTTNNSSAPPKSVAPPPLTSLPKVHAGHTAAPLAKQPAQMTEAGSIDSTITSTATSTAIATPPTPAKEDNAASTGTALANVTTDSDSTTAKALVLIAHELGVETTELEADASFANLGVDSLMSLVLSEKFRQNLGIAVSGSLFLEYPTIGDLTAWLGQYYS